MRLNKKLLPYLLVLLGILSLDLGTKVLTENWLGYQNSFEVIPNFFWIHVLRNTGGAWSLLAGQDLIFLIIPPVAFGFMAYYFSKATSTQTLFKTALIFLMAGTLGNYIDRIMLGYVRDFLSFNTFGYMFPVFNVADMSLNIGVALLILETLLEGRK